MRHTASNAQRNLNVSSHHHQPLQLALWLTAGFALVEFAGGLISGSLALLADAGHMASDIVALMLAIMASNIANRPAHAQMTYGYGRAKVLAAQLNGLGLWLLSFWILWEGWQRLLNPPDVNGNIMVAIAVLGLVINLIVMKWLHGSHDLNSRAAYWHVLGDALGSVAAVVAGIVIILTGWMPIDPILSFLVAAIIAWGGWRLLHETTLELMAAVPAGVDLKSIENMLIQIDDVIGIHHIHIWTLPDSKLAISAHIQLECIEHWPALLPKLQSALQQQNIFHVTLQPELTYHANNCNCLKECSEDFNT